MKWVDRILALLPDYAFVVEPPSDEYGRRQRELDVKWETNVLRISPGLETPNER